tara:strand:+ start:242 stop:478 length:237 start_codon:yes stop_codon:yes gene_type:complete
MANFVKFKNSFKGNVTDEIWINVDRIYTFFATLKTDANNEMNTVTTLYAGQEGSWEVDDSIEDVYKKIEKVTSSRKSI